MKTDSREQDLLRRSGSIVVMCSLALIAAATLFPFDFSFDQYVSFSNKFKLSRAIESRGHDLIIGADAALDQPFRGKIDELRIYRIALTPDEIAQEAKHVPGAGSVGRPTEGLVASYSFDGISGAVLRDGSGNGNDGKLVDGARWNAEGHRGALVFDGSGQHVRVPNKPSIDIGGQNLTISMRIALQDSPSDGVIVAKPWYPGAMRYPYYQYGVEFDGSDAKSVDLYFGDASGRARGPFSVKPPLGAWTHVAFVYDGVVRGYVDGREQAVTGLVDDWDLGDILINLLLFIPLGFGLAIKAQARGWPSKKAVPVVLLLGALVSLGVEILQCWLPARYPSLIDIGTNSASSILGAILCLVAGRHGFARFRRLG